MKNLEKAMMVVMEATEELNNMYADYKEEVKEINKVLPKVGFSGLSDYQKVLYKDMMAEQLKALFTKDFVESGLVIIEGLKPDYFFFTKELNVNLFDKFPRLNYTNRMEKAKIASQLKVVESYVKFSNKTAISKFEDNRPIIKQSIYGLEATYFLDNKEVQFQEVC